MKSADNSFDKHRVQVGTGVRYLESSVAAWVQAQEVQLPSLKSSLS